MRLEEGRTLRDYFNSRIIESPSIADRVISNLRNECSPDGDAPSIKDQTVRIVFREQERKRLVKAKNKISKNLKVAQKTGDGDRAQILETAQKSLSLEGISKSYDPYDPKLIFQDWLGLYIEEFKADRNFNCKFSDILFGLLCEDDVDRLERELDVEQ